MTFKWKRILSAVLAMLCLTVSLAGCDKEGASSSELSDSSNYEEEQKPVHKIGYIFHDDVDEFTFSSEMNNQRILAANRSNADTCYIENVSITDFEAAVKKLVDNGCTDIVSTSSIYTNMLTSISNRYMNVNFIGYGTVSGGSNISCYTEQPYQGAYAAGVAAAYNSHSRKIGFVGDIDMLYLVPTVNAAALGTQAVFSTATTYLAMATEDEEIENAIDSLVSTGCDVVICYTSSAHAEKYCQQKGVKFIGSHDFSETEADYSNMLMYFYTRRDSYFLAQFKQMQLDTWQPGVYTGNMGNGVVCISEALSANKDAGCQKVLDSLSVKLATGGLIFSGQLIDNEGIVQYLQTDTMTDNQVYAMSWYVQGVESAGNFKEPKYNVAPNDLEIKF